MAITKRSDLKDEFVDGQPATQEGFADMIDSAYNRAEDSVLMGPLGQTGKYGLLGPTGGTYIGAYIINNTTTINPNSAGSTGQIVFQAGPTSVNMFVHNGTQWFKFTGLSTF